LETEALEIDGEQYTVVDSHCNCVTGIGNQWVSGATVSVILDVDNKQAYLQSATSGAMIATGSYVGTGKSGKSNPNTLTFDFIPKVLWVGKGGFLNFTTHPTSKHSTLSNQMLITCPEEADNVPVYALNGGTLFDGTIHFSIDGRTVSWYSQGQYTQIDGIYQYIGAEDLQLNTLGETYHYFAIG
jgi:hypothetical protein